MVIKEQYKGVKNLYKADGFMLLEAVALVGFVALVGSGITSLHGLIMNSYHTTEISMRALSYAEDCMASALTGVPNRSPCDTLSHNTLSHNTLSHNRVTAQKDFFKNQVTKTHGVSFLPTQKPYSVVTVKVSWREQGAEKKIELTRLVADKEVSI